MIMILNKLKIMSIKIKNNNNYNNNNINQNKINNYNDNNNKDNKNVYPSFGDCCTNTDNNMGYNKNNLNNYYTNNNNNNKKDMNLMNELTEVFAKQQEQENNNMNNDLPTLSQINNAKNNNKNNENDELIDYIGNLNKNVPMDSVKECAPVTLNKVELKPKNSNMPIKEDFDIGSQIQLNIYNNNQNLDNIKKVYVNNSTFKTPENQDYYDDENPYNDY